MPDRLYLDHAATTPVLPEARAAAAEAMAVWANPSSPHAEGRKARSALEAARAGIADALGWRHDVILTSGATEALGIVGRRCLMARRLVGATEHDAVPAALANAEILPVSSSGIIDLEALEQSLRRGPALVAIQQVNNETGVVQPLSAIVEVIRSHGALLLADCAQSAGKLPLPDADFIALSGHKFGAPPGCGALLVKDLTRLEADGGQERGYRRGTENLPAAAAMAAALRSSAFRSRAEDVTRLRATLESALVEKGGMVVADQSERSPWIGAYAMRGVDRSSQLVQFDLAGIAVSAGSACSSGSMKPSRVLQAMGIAEEIAESTIRVSFGPDTVDDDIDRVLGGWERIQERATSRAA